MTFLRANLRIYRTSVNVYASGVIIAAACPMTCWLYTAGLDAGLDDG